MNTTSRKAGVLTEFLGGFASVFRGMAVTFVNLVARPKVTVQYPYERLQVSPRYRGLFYLPYDPEAERLKCVGCTLCAQACPTDVISMTKLGAGKHAGVSEFDMDLGRCLFCNLCVEACPFEAIYMGPAYELASYDRNVSLFRIQDLAQGGAPSVDKNVKTISAALAEEAARKVAAAKEGAAHPHESKRPAPKPEEPA